MNDKPTRAQRDCESRGGEDAEGGSMTPHTAEYLHSFLPDEVYKDYQANVPE